MEDISIKGVPPTAEELFKLRTSSGLSAPPPTVDITKAIKSSVHCVVARVSATGEAIGMVRLVGDGQLFCQITDMAVLPSFQGRGIGKALLDEMLKWIDENAPGAYVNLIGDAPGQKLYRSRGFVETSGIGMKRSAWGR